MFSYWSLYNMRFSPRGATWLKPVAGATPFRFAWLNHPVAESPEQGEFVASMHPPLLWRSILFSNYSFIMSFFTCTITIMLICRHNVLWYCDVMYYVYAGPVWWLITQAGAACQHAGTQLLARCHAAYHCLYPDRWPSPDISLSFKCRLQRLWLALKAGVLLVVFSLVASQPVNHSLC